MFKPTTTCTEQAACTIFTKTVPTASVPNEITVTFGQKIE